MSCPKFCVGDACRHVHAIAEDVIPIDHDIAETSGPDIRKRRASRLGNPMASMPTAQWSLLYALAMLAMWWVMMLAMMLPSAAPAVLQFAAIERLRPSPETGSRTIVFATGYGLTWGAFSLAAVALQWRLGEARLLSPMLSTGARWLAGGLLMAAGLWQLSPMKHVCLAHCRSPVPFLVANWRRGPLGMGLRHGAYCLGCCWALMLLLFYGGVMNLYWIAGLSAVVLVEKVLPGGIWLARIFGGALLAWGLALSMAWV
jgi:predicted metal-binding membrane protein